MTSVEKRAYNYYYSAYMEGYMSLEDMNEKIDMEVFLWQTYLN